MKQSEKLFARAQRHIPGGVNSPVRAFGAVGGTPPFIERASGALVFDADGREFIDYVGSWGPMILGHAHPAVQAAVKAQMNRGASFGAPTEIEIEMAELICERMPSIESVRMVNSGTEATMSAIRLARAATGRDTIVKFAGCYHGHSDHLLVNAGSGALTFGIPSSPGVPADFARHTLTLPYNDTEAVRKTFDEFGSEIAAVIVEPIAGNMNCIAPLPGFLETLRKRCSASGSILIFDEVMTGFRVASGGAQERLGLVPDLTCLGKIIGGGLPVGAFGGRRDLMQQLAPAGPVYQAGTLSGNPLAMSAGLATLRLLAQEGLYEQLEETTHRLIQGLTQIGATVPLAGRHVGSMFGVFVGTDQAPDDLAGVLALDESSFKRYFHAMLDRGIYLAPSAYEAGFVSLAHGADQIDRTIEAADAALRSI